MPVKFEFTMLKGRQNYLCTRRLARTLPQAGKLFTSSDEQELQRIHEWSKKTADGSLSDFDMSRTPKSGSRSAPSAACARRNCAASNPIL